MNDLFIIFIVIFILIIFVALFALLYYMNDKYITYTHDVNDNLTKSEQVINDTSRAFNKLQDNVINKLATVDNNQDKIMNTGHRSVYTLNSNLANIFEIINDNIVIKDISASNIDIAKSVNINMKPDITTYKNVSSLTDNTRFINICDTNGDPLKRKCVNVNIDNDGIFNIYTKNKLNNNSNINTVAIRDHNNDIMALFNGSNKTISLGSNISPAINITSNLYTPDIIVCNYKYTKTTDPAGAININFISNFDIKANSFLNFIISEDYISRITGTFSGYTSIDYSNYNLKIQPNAIIPKNTIKTLNINVDFKAFNIVDTSSKFNTNGFITLS